MSKGSLAEQALRALAIPGNIAHLVGDSIIENMKDDSGNGLEGNIVSESLAFLSTSLNMVLQDHQELASDKLQKLHHRLEQAQNLDSAWKKLIRDDGGEKICFIHRPFGRKTS